MPSSGVEWRNEAPLSPAGLRRFSGWRGVSAQRCGSKTVSENGVRDNRLIDRLDVHWRRTVSYHPDYGWVMQQNTGPTPQSYVFEAQAAAYSHYWRRDRYGYVIEEGNVVDQGTPGVFGRRLEGLDAWGNPTQKQFGNGLVDLRTYRPATGQMHTVCVGAGVGLCGTLEMNYDSDTWGWPWYCQVRLPQPS